ncbi:hypothetical protein PI95_015670 [Hassallia byssoidea VB512170]|uniref:Uncharacterized protein n=1 Tax=Hassallia byssoidea VB512170 TaxID=1304833 RepID=A0A846H9B7_9CYAN|nr:hypothetical protein [Hassalia byssoidea]NEU73956.1 hypothetical protein [Hassalia byssoidea VB512170]
MNLSNYNFKYFAYLALLTILLGILAKFDGTVTVQVTPLGLQVQVNNHSAGCPIDPQLLEIQPKLEQELA